MGTSPEVSSAEDGLEVSETHGNHVLRSHVLAALGDGWSVEMLQGSEAVFRDLLNEYNDINHPLIHAYATWDLGCTALAT